MQELEPQIAELLRTCVHPPSLLLRVAHVELVDVKYDRHEKTASKCGLITQQYDGTHRYATNFLLTDGQLMIQALLHRKLSGLGDAGAVRIGDFLDIRSFSVKKSARLNGAGKVVYLAIEDCHFLLLPYEHVDGRKVEGGTRGEANERPRKRKRSSPQVGENGRLQTSSSDEDDTAGGSYRKSPSKKTRFSDRVGTRVDDFIEEQFGSLDDLHDEGEAMLVPPSAQVGHGTESGTHPAVEVRHPVDGMTERKEAGSMPDDFSSPVFTSPGPPTQDEDDDEDDFFEEASLNLAAVKERRRALQKLDMNALVSPKAASVTATSVKISDLYIHKPITAALSLPTPQTTGRVSQVEPEREQLHTQDGSRLSHPPHDSRRDGTFALSQESRVPTLQQRPASAHVSRPDGIVAPQIPTQKKTQTQQQVLLPQPPFNPLRMLRNPPSGRSLPSKNYMLTTLAFISWTGTSLIHRAGSPFPPKRHLKIVDPSLASSRPPSRDDIPQQAAPTAVAFKAQSAFQDSVTVAVYIDAADFQPAAGTLVLFRGLVMQRLGNGDIILNAYGKLKDQRFEEGQSNGTSKISGSEGQPPEYDGPHSHWFITNPEKIRALGHGSRYDYYIDWWKERNASASTGITQ